MSENMVIRKQSYAWELHDSIQTVQHGPTVTDPETGKKVEVLAVYFVYGWKQGWFLKDVTAVGPALDEGEYLPGPYVECCFGDPVEGDGGAGRAPQPLIDLAERRMALLPDPPALPEGSA